VLLVFVQRHSLLRLSVSLTTLRHFLAVVAVVAAIMLSGPALQVEDSEVFRRLVAWSVLVALLAGTLYSAVSGTVAARSPALRRLLEPGVRVSEVESLVRRLRSLDGDGERLAAVVSERLGEWLGTTVRMVGREAAGAALAAYFSAPTHRGGDLVDAPPVLAELLARGGFHAAFPLRVGDRLEQVLVIEGGVAGGGVREGERETVELVLAQLATVLELRHLAAERLAAERRAAEQERLGTLGLVAASLAHEVKNPLAAMKALAQTVHEELAASSAEQAADLAVIIAEIDRLEAVTREILGFARPRGDESTVLRDVVAGAVYILRAEARRRGVTLEDGAVEEVGVVPGSAAGWQSVVFNLILNAVQHAPDGTPVTVSLARAGGTILFETVNGGPAIPAAIADRLFEAFVSDGGTGLGLAIAARRAAALGASLAVANHEGDVRFRLTLADLREV
jgi:signal transduction histidine kinase